MRVYSGSIITCDQSDNVYKYLVENRGEIIYVGDQLPQKFKNKPILELGEKALLPSFCDTHIHFSNFAFFAQQLYFQGITSFQQAREQLQNYVNNNKPKAVIGFGLSAHSLKEKHLPFRQELDEWCSNLPVMIISYEGHSLVVNSLMLAKLPPEIKELRGYDPEKGLLEQEAYFLGADFVTSFVSPLTLLNNLLKSVDLLAEKGIGMIHPVEGIGFPRDLDVDLVRYVARSQKEGFQFRINFQTMDVDKVLKRKLPRIGGCFATALDGAFTPLDAALKEGYTNNPDNKGILFYSDDELIQFAKEAHNANLQISFHAIGDAAFEQATRVLETTILANPREDHRHTIIHACLPTEEGLKKCSELGICISAQPVFLHFKEEPVEFLQEILGERHKKISPFRKMLDMGIHISGSSDGPVSSPDPIRGIHSACNHYVPEQSITIQEALKMFTYQAAFMGFDEKERGSLEVGKIADMVILNKNPLEMKTENLLELKVEELYLQGKKYKGKQGLGSFLLRFLSRKGRKKKI